jgi:hypothetical protein
MTQINQPDSDTLSLDANFIMPFFHLAKSLHGFQESLSFSVPDLAKFMENFDLLLPESCAMNSIILLILRTQQSERIYFTQGPWGIKHCTLQDQLASRLPTLKLSTLQQRLASICSTRNSNGFLSFFVTGDPAEYNS